MLLESWSLHINEMEKLYNSDILYLEYVKSFNSSLKNLINELSKYLPDEKDKYNIVDTFMNIFQIVKKNYKKLVYNIMNISIQKIKTVKKQILLESQK